MGDRRGETTRWLRAAAFDEFVEVGPRAISLVAVSRRGHYSVGAVAQRWPTARDLIHDVAANEVLPRVRSLAHAAPESGLGSWIDYCLTDSSNSRTIRSVAELLFAARDDSELTCMAEAAIADLRASVPVMSDRTDRMSGLTWWATALALGEALLTHSGCDIPPLGSGVDQLATVLIARADARSFPPAPAESGAVMITDPQPTPPLASDATGQALIDAGRSIIVTSGVERATTREITSEAGVTTGALYRRYPDRDTLMRDIFSAELTPERYAWSAELVDAIACDPNFDRATNLLVAITRRLWEDSDTAHVLLELSMTAHESPTVRAVICTEVNRAQQARQELFTSIVAAELATIDLDPELLSWLFQVVPTGARLLASLGIVPSNDELTAVLGLFPLIFAQPAN